MAAGGASLLRAILPLPLLAALLRGTGAELTHTEQLAASKSRLAPPMSAGCTLDARLLNAAVELEGATAEEREGATAEERRTGPP
jgi:hypothetical protein